MNVLFQIYFPANQGLIYLMKNTVKKNSSDVKYY